MAQTEEKEGSEKTEEVLGLIGLNTQEIDTYFKITGRGAVTKGEISILKNISFGETNKIVEKLASKGLLREIPGKTPQYAALPPYSALLSQISQFKTLISDLQAKMPKELDKRFKVFEEQSIKIKKLDEYQSYLKKIRNELPLHINRQLNSLQLGLEQVKKLQEFNKFLDELKGQVSKELNNEFIRFKKLFDNIKNKIISVFEKQLRMVALKDFVEKIVTGIINEEFSHIKDYFEQTFVNKIDFTLNTALKKIFSVSDTADEISFSIKDTFSSISKNLNETLQDTETKLSDVQNEILKAFDAIKLVYKTEIFKAVESDILSNIIKQVELSENTMQEFWERAKKVTPINYQDVWFIRTKEAMKAQINDIISRAKMRAYIIAPQFQDIDVEPLKNIPNHVNLRISALIVPSTDKENYEYLLKKDNISIRHYSRQNIWAINRDHEEIVVCVTSPSTDGDAYEIAGMGSVLDEHIKMFAGILEEIWMQSTKLDETQFEEKKDISVEKPKKTVKSKKSKKAKG